jgi:mycothiol synthase
MGARVDPIRSREHAGGRRYGGGVTLPAALHGRPLRPADAEPWAQLCAAVEEADRRGEHYSAADLAEELTDPELDLERDSVLLLDGDHAVAYQVLRPAAGTHLHPDAAVHPDHRRRGIGAALLAMALRRAAELDAILHVRVPEHVTGAVALVEGAGFAPVRWWSELSRDLDAPIQPVPPPAALELRELGPGYDAARWDEPLRAARNATFADHWGSVPESAEAFAHRRTATRGFRPECSAAACTPDGLVAGFLLGYEQDAETERTGSRDLYVGTVGTLSPWRGRGIAAALLAHALLRAREHGFATSSLTVDAQNPTGALGVYSRSGYALRHREITYAPLT